jgi:predicted enzyme related to lactoylglutathione lyase
MQMHDDQLKDDLTRRAALMLAAAAAPALAQTGPKPAGHPVVYFEIGCRDRAKSADFYSKLFDWQMTDAGAASTIDTGSASGIPGHIVSLGHEPQNYTIFYVEVDDVKAALDKAVALGGKAVVGPITIPTGIFAWLADQDGNMVGLLKQTKR